MWRLCLEGRIEEHKGRWPRISIVDSCIQRLLAATCQVDGLDGLSSTLCINKWTLSFASVSISGFRLTQGVT